MNIEKVLALSCKGKIEAHNRTGLNLSDGKGPDHLSWRENQNPNRPKEQVKGSGGRLYEIAKLAEITKKEIATGYLLAHTYNHFMGCLEFLEEELTQQEEEFWQNTQRAIKQPWLPEPVLPYRLERLRKLVKAAQEVEVSE